MIFVKICLVILLFLFLLPPIVRVCFKVWMVIALVVMAVKEAKK